jgi:hypothetical protein
MRGFTEVLFTPKKVLCLAIIKEKLNDWQANGYSVTFVNYYGSSPSS